MILSTTAKKINENGVGLKIVSNGLFAGPYFHWGFSGSGTKSLVFLQIVKRAARKGTETQGLTEISQKNVSKH